MDDVLPINDSKAGTASAGLAELFELHRVELQRFLAARSGRPEDAADLLHDLWLRICSAKPGPIANGRAYLFRMANNLILDALRRNQRSMARDRSWLVADGCGDIAPDERPDRAILPDEEIARGQEAAVLERAIAMLPPGAQRALRLHRLDELSQAEVANVMGISRSGVEKHLAVAMKHLRKALGDCGWFAVAASQEQGAGEAVEIRPETQP